MTAEDWFTQVDRAANEYFARPDSYPECFVRISPPPLVGSQPNQEDSRLYRVQYEANGKHRIEPVNWQSAPGRGQQHTLGATMTTVDLSPAIFGLIRSLPPATIPRKPWPREQKLKWLAAFEVVLEMTYPEPEGNGNSAGVSQ